MHFLGLKAQRSRGVQRPLRLLRRRVEGELLVRVAGLRSELVDVLPGDRHERAAGRRRHLRVGESQLRNRDNVGARERQRAVLAVCDAVAGDVARRLEPRSVARDRAVDLRDAGERLVDERTDLVQAGRIGVKS